MFLALGLFSVTVSGADSGKVFIRTSTLLGTDIPPQDREKLSVAISADGLSWQRLFKKPTLTNFSRDASVIQHGSEFIAVYTDAFNSTNGTFGLARSTNLVDWTATNVALAGPAITNTPNNTWAPEWFIDGDSYYVMVRSSQRNTGFTNFPNYAPPGIGYMQCLDPGTWTNWTDFTPVAELEPAYENDPFMIKVGETYHLFTDHFNYPGGPAILHRRSTNGPFSGYTAPVNIAANFSSAPAYVTSGLNRSTPWEGQFVLPLGGDHYRLYFQAVWYDASFCIESYDGMQSWDANSMRRITYDELPAFGHGSILAIGAAETVNPIAAAARRADEAIAEAQSIRTSPNSYNLYTASEMAESRASGRNDVTSNPVSHGLYTPQMIADMNLGGVVLQKSGNSAIVRLQLETTPVLSNAFSAHGAEVEIPVELPGDKHFLRIRALGPR